MSAFKILLDFCSINYLELRIFQIGPKENLHLRTFRRETWIKQLTRINQVRSKSGDRCKIVDACEQKKFTCCPRSCSVYICSAFLHCAFSKKFTYCPARAVFTVFGASIRLTVNHPRSLWKITWCALPNSGGIAKHNLDIFSMQLTTNISLTSLVGGYLGQNKSRRIFTELFCSSWFFKPPVYPVLIMAL